MIVMMLKGFLMLFFLEELFTVKAFGCLLLDVTGLSKSDFGEHGTKDLVNENGKEYDVAICSHSIWVLTPSTASDLLWTTCA